MDYEFAIHPVKSMIGAPRTLEILVLDGSLKIIISISKMKQIFHGMY
jgi:hypothetical protein